MSSVNFEARYSQLNTQFSGLKEKLEVAGTHEEIDKLTAQFNTIKGELKDLNTQWNTHVASLQGRVSHVQLLKMISSQPWTQTAQNINKLVSEIKTEIDTRDGRLQHREFLFSKINVFAGDKEALNTLESVGSPKEREIIKQYKDQIQKADPPLSPEMKKAVLKTIIVALTAKTMTGSHDRTISVRVDQQKYQFFVKLEGGKIKIVSTRELGQGADATIYHLSQEVLKVPKLHTEAQESHRNEVQIFTQKLANASRLEPGANNVEEFRGVRPLQGGDEGLVVKYYNRGDFKDQVVLHRFAHNLLQVSERKLRNMSPDERVKLVTDLKAKFEEIKKIDDEKDPGKSQLIKEFEDKFKTSFVDAKALQAKVIDFCVNAEMSLDKIGSGLKNYKAMDRHERENMCNDLINGYSFLMRHGVIPGDIKPENVRWEIVDGHPHFVHGDFGRSSSFDPKVLQQVQRFITTREAMGVETKQAHADCMNDFQYLISAFSSQSEKGKIRILDLDTALQRFTEAGLLTQVGNQLMPNAKVLDEFRHILPLLEKGTAPYQDTDFFKQLINTGLIKAGSQGYEVAFKLSDEDRKIMRGVFSKMTHPAKGLVGSIEYSTLQDVEWMNHCVSVGDMEGFRRAVESQQQFALGVSLYEMVTGLSLKKDGNSVASITDDEMKKIKKRLESHGLSETMVTKITGMLRSQGIPPRDLIQLLMDKQNAAFDAKEPAKEVEIVEDIKKLRNVIGDMERNRQYNPLPAAYVELAHKYMAIDGEALASALKAAKESKDKKTEEQIYQTMYQAVAPKLMHSPRPTL